MRTWILAGAALVVCAGLVYAAVSFGTNAASMVIGQASFTNSGATTNAFGLDHPSDGHVHTTIRTSFSVLADNGLYVADEGNNRVMLYYTPQSSDTEADMIYGQPSESDSTAGTAINRFDSPTAVTAYNAYDHYQTDPNGDSSVPPDTGYRIDNTLRTRLWVSDAGNNRVLRIDNPQVNSASAVYGQPGFTTNTANIGGLSAATLSNPQGLFAKAGDASGETDVDLLVADAGNNRVLFYENCLADTAADLVLGQPDMTSNGINRGAGAGNPANNSLHNPTDVFVDQMNRIYICDRGNHRVVRDDNFDGIWDYVFGPPNMTTFVTGTTRDYLHYPRRIELEGALTNEDDVLYVADEGNNRVVIYGNVANTEADTIIGQYSLFSYTDSAPFLSDTGLLNPSGVERQGGLLYVIDMNHNRVMGFPLFSTVTGGTTPTSTASGLFLHANPAYVLYDNSTDVQETTVLTVTVQDSAGATVTYNGTGTLSCTGVGGTVSCDVSSLTFTNGVTQATLTLTRGLGVATFSATLRATLNGGVYGETTLVLTEDSSIVPSPSPAPSTAGEGDRLCFVATAAFEDEPAWQVDSLRAFRDGVLMENRLGRSAVAAYYAYGPYPARSLAQSPTAKSLFRALLTPAALLAELPLLLVALALSAGGLAVKFALKLK